MPKTGRPRYGSMGVWPRKRAKKMCPRVRSWAKKKEACALGFAGFKVGMTHIHYTDNRKASTTKGEDIVCPVTVVEVPPMKMMAIKFYKKDAYGMQLKTQVNAKQVDKQLSRKMIVPKKVDEKKIEQIKPEDYDDYKGKYAVEDTRHALIEAKSAGIHPFN